MRFLPPRTWACWTLQLVIFAPLPGDLADQVSSQFPSQVDLATVDVLVIDRHGDPVGGLGPGDFIVREDGQLQSVTAFEAVTAGGLAGRVSPETSPIATNSGAEGLLPRSFVLVFDDLHLSHRGAERARIAVGRLVREVLLDGDLLTIVPTSGGRSWTLRASDGAEGALRFLARFKGRSSVSSSVLGSVSEASATRAVTLHGGSNGDGGVPPNAQLVYAESSSRNRGTLLVLRRTLESMSSIRGRKSVILLSEGFVYDPTLVELRELRKLAQRVDAAIDFVDPTGLDLPDRGADEIGHGEDIDNSQGPSDARQQSEGARSLASDTGGRIVQNTNDLLRPFQQIAQELRNHYLLGFVSTNPKHDGKFRRIRVEVRRKDVDVRAAKGYFAPSDKRSEIATANALDPEVRRALDSPYGANSLPLRLTAYVIGGSGGKGEVLLVAEADPRGVSFLDRGERSEGTLDSFAVVVARDTGETFASQKRIDLSLPPIERTRLDQTWIPITTELALPPGAYEARLAIRDARTGRVGSVWHAFDVLEPKGFRISTPILTDELRRSAEGSDVPSPVPLARRTFPAGAPISCAYRLYGAATDAATGETSVSAGYVVRGPDGSIPRKQEPQLLSMGPRDGTWHLLALPMQGMPEGQLELVLTLKDEVSRKILEVREPFRIATAQAPQDP